MSDPNQPDPPITPAQEAAVRRVLAQSGGPEAMPAEVVARLDAVLGDLVSERVSERADEHAQADDDSGADDGEGIADGAPPAFPPSAPAAEPLPAADASRTVLPMDPAARRRRVRARIVLGLAAASVAVAVGAGLLRDDDNSDLSADGLSKNTPARSESATTDSARPQKTLGAQPSSAPSNAEPLPSDGAHDSDYGITRVVSDQPLRTVQRSRLRDDLTALRRASLPHPADADYSAATLTAPADFRCEPADYGPGYLVGVMYEGHPAVVAFREPTGTTQEAEVLTCGTADVLHSTTLPAE